MRQFHAPGRVNLIGDHIDYMGGTVMPMAIDRGTDIWVTPRGDRRLVAFSDDFPEVGQVVASVDARHYDPDWHWANYLAAIAHTLQSRGLELPGVDVRVRGRIPHGAGLSSSASLELAMAVAFDALVCAGLSARELAIAAQHAENEFISVACGIMDQLAVAAGVAGHALLIDCGTLQVEPVPFPDGLSVVVANTNQRRELTESAYNQRRADCERAQALLGYPLVDVPAVDNARVLGRLPVELRPRARHVVTEQARVIEFAEALRTNDRETMGSLMRASHESLRDDFEVTGTALDAMVESAWEAPGCVGARMTGAGFGGCTVNLVEPAVVDDFISHVGSRYRAVTGLRPDFYEVRAADGAHEVVT